MSMDTFKSRSTELVSRIRDRALGIRIPGQRSFESQSDYEQHDKVELSENFLSVYNFMTTEQTQQDPGQFSEMLKSILKASGMTFPQPGVERDMPTSGTSV
jgi:hypothetical protein